MTDIVFSCPHCRQSIEAPPDMAGQLIECPSCKQTIEVTKFPKPPAMPRSFPSRANKACPYCGSEIPSTAQKCKHCGEWVVNKPTTNNGDESEKKILPLFLLWFFLGALGAHAFYAGRSGQGFMFLLCLITSFLVIPGILLIIMLLWDLILILSGSYPDGNNNKIVKWT